jgi:hypothetical protein
MKGAKILTLLIFSIAVALTGCSGPIGGLLNSIDYIKVVPKKILYGEGDWFIPAEHVKVVSVFSGVEETIDIDNVKIKLILDPDATNDGSDKEYPVTNNQNGLRLTNQGPYTVVVTYKKMEVRYDIAVGAPGTGDVAWGDREGSGIILNW